MDRFRSNLSPFGQKVFDILATRERTARNNRNFNNFLEPCRSRKNKYAQNRIITFGESQIVNRPTLFNENFDDEDYLVVREDSAQVPSFEWRSTLPGPVLLTPAPPAPVTTHPQFTHSELDVPTSAELVTVPDKNNNYHGGNTLFPPANQHSLFPPANQHSLFPPANQHSLFPPENQHSLFPSENQHSLFPPANQLNTNRHILDEIYGLSDEDDNDCCVPLQTYIRTRSNNNNDTAMKSDLEECRSQDVQWDEMFDDLLSHTDLINIPVKHTEECATDDLIQLPIQDGSEKTDDIFIKPKQVTGTKRNKKITDMVPKKVKKVKIESLKKPKVKSKDTGNYSFRKEKYTKTVSKWLDNVSPSNPIDDTDEKSNGDVPPQAAVAAKDTNKKTVNEKAKKKKVVQAQLANKDGIMKFKKPAGISSPPKIAETVVNADINKTIESTNSNKNTQSNTKQRKSQSKFVAPIKSQIPVRDITYEVHVFDTGNIAEHNLNTVIKKEIIGVLIYSNGFCQLNVHHAAAAEQSVPEGLMFCFDDIFYYFKGADKRIGENILNILQVNTLVCYDGKSIFIYLMTCFNLDLDPTVLTTMDMKIAGALLSPDSPPADFSALQRLAASPPQFTVATDCPLQKAAWYCSLLADCSQALRTKLQEDQLWTVFTDIEMPIVPIIAEMEGRGVLVDTAALSSMTAAVGARLARVEAACHAAAGRRFPLLSAPQLRALLYDELQLHRLCNVTVTETKATSAQSVSEAMLLQLGTAHRLPRLVLDYRRLHKAHATFLAGIATHVKDGILKPTWDQMAAATGRIGCSNPNLQAIPKAPLILTGSDLNDGDQGQEVGGPLQLRSWLVSGAGRLLLSADFRHVECRVLAAAAHDQRLAAALQKDDLFQTLAAGWLQKPEAEVCALERERTKRIVYASLYGAGARKLMDILDVDYQQALAISASFNRTFPSLKQFGAEVVSRMRAAGGAVRSLLGRARRPGQGVGGGGDDDRAHRQAVNFVIQGSAADICKLAMAACARVLRGVRSEVGVGGTEVGGARLLLQLHDELVFSLPAEQLHTVAAAVRTAMEHCGAGAGLTTLPVRLTAGAHWGDLRDYDPRLPPQHYTQ